MSAVPPPLPSSIQTNPETPGQGPDVGVGVGGGGGVGVGAVHKEFIQRYGLQHVAPKQDAPGPPHVGVGVGGGGMVGVGVGVGATSVYSMQIAVTPSEAGFVVSVQVAKSISIHVL